jgi:exonuclease SbcC
VRIGRVRYRNIGPFKNVDVDLAAIGGKLVAVTGDNGAGKSTFLELIAGAMFRECPTRGALTKLATARDAMAEVELLDSGLTIRQTVDCISKKSEALVIGPDGAPVLESAKVRDFDSYAAAHLPAPAVLYCSSFAAQGSEGFAELAASERKRIILQITQTERLERLAELAREYSRSAKSGVDVLRARLADLRSKTPDLEQSRAAATSADEALRAAKTALEAAQSRLDLAKAAESNVAEAARLWKQRLTAITDLDAARSELAGVEKRIGNNREVLADEVAIRAAATETEHWRAELTRLTGEATAATDRLSRLQTEMADKRRHAERCRSRISELDARRNAARKVLDGRTAIEQAAARIVEIDAELPVREAERTALRATVQTLSDALLTSKDDRITGLRTGLECIRDEVEDPIAAAVEALEGDDDNAMHASLAPQTIAEHRYTVTELDTLIAVLGKERRALEPIAAKASALDHAAKTVVECAEESETFAAEMTTYTDHVARLQAEAAELSASVKTLAAAVDSSGAEVDIRASKAALLPRLDTATARLDELTPRAEQLVQSITKLEASIAELPSTPPGTSGVSTAQLDYDHQADKHDTASSALIRAALTVEQAEQAVESIAKLDADIANAADDHSDWFRLGTDLGKDGLQALIVDCALPEINELANDLLHSCHGPRFTIEVTSQRQSADGKRTLEDLDVMVTDTEHGRHDTIETYSGGERVILGEALALALTMISCKANGRSGDTLIRDESGAALSDVNGRAYIAMLRRAVDVIGADRCLFVSHNAELQELADARIVIADGTATVA